MQAAFREEGFTQVVLEILEDLGQTSGAEVCFFEKLVGRGKVRVNGWHFEEDEAQLDIVATIFRDTDQPCSLARSDVQRAIKQAAHLWDVAERGFHEEMEPASDAFAMLQRIHQWLRPGGFVLISLEAADLDDVRGEWLGVPMFMSCFDPETVKRLVNDAGFEILETAIETQVEQNHDVPYLWLIARKP